MNTITINRENAIAAYNQAEGTTRVMLGTLFGKQITNPDPCEIFKTWEDVADAERIRTDNMPYKFPEKPAERLANAAFKLAVIFEAFNKRTGDDFNEKWIPDYGNKDQWKYEPFFAGVPSLGAFVYSHADSAYTYTFLGARLCTENDDYATYIGKQFIDIWNEFLNPSK
jgi:hypothetical protein